MNASIVTKRPVMKEPFRLQLPDRIGLAGALAGLVGGLGMWLVTVLLTQALDLDSWLQLKVIASMVLGSSVIGQAGFVAGTVAVGMLLHLVVAMALGVIFEIGFRNIARLPSDMGVPELAGLVFGLLIWLIVYFVIAPIVSPVLLQIYAPAFIIQHIVFGIVTGLIYGILRPQPYATMP